MSETSALPEVPQGRCAGVRVAVQEANGPPGGAVAGIVQKSAGPARGHPGPRLVFGLTVWDESPDQLRWCLGHLRRAYAPGTADVFVIADGSDRPGYRSACAEHAAAYLPAERLKVLAAGARWWERFFRTAAGYDADFAFKMDPDTQAHRRFRGFPDLDVFGTLEGEGRTQGGIQGFGCSAVKRVLDSRVCLDPAYPDPSAWATDEGVRRYVERLGQISTDYILADVVRRLGLTCGDWAEVDSLSHQYRPFRVGTAATHPHKLA